MIRLLDSVAPHARFLPCTTISSERYVCMGICFAFQTLLQAISFPLYSIYLSTSYFFPQQPPLLALNLPTPSA
jgi:hypothetical protein